MLLDVGTTNVREGLGGGHRRVVKYERGAVRPEEMEDLAEGGAILKVVAERQHEDGQDLVQKEGTHVLDDHAVDSTNCVVLRAQSCRWTGNRDAVKERLGLGQNRHVLGREVYVSIVASVSPSAV